jgi:hypothetical protein
MLMAHLSINYEKVVLIQELYIKLYVALKNRL